jgi:peptidoglycan-N-acetylglucosamine deacetylase
LNRMFVLLSLLVLTVAAWWFFRPGDDIVPLPLVQPAPIPSAIQVDPVKPRVLAPTDKTPRKVSAEPGARQPVAPGFKRIKPLPEIKLEPRIPELAKLEYLGNGHIEVANALVLVPGAGGRLEVILPLAQSVAKRTLAARPSLDEVDLSIYRREDYAGFGGPSPYFTASVPRDRLLEFLKLTPNASDYDRLWINPKTPAPPERDASGATETGVTEVNPTLEGSSHDLQVQQALQLEQAQNGFKPAHLAYYHGPPNSKRVALTFDDAVHPMYVPLLLDALERGHAKATFFVVGRNVEAYPYFVRDLDKAGHELANHTFHHMRLNNLPDAVIRDELDRTNQIISSITGKSVRFFRPPGGRYSSKVLQIARSLGMTTAFWTDDPGDFNNPGQVVLERRTLRRIRRGGIILLHDNAQETAPILFEVLNDARAKGFELVTLATQSGR